MDNTEANEIRLVANEIMRKLYMDRKKEQLEILRNYAIRAIEEIDKQTSSGR